MPLLLATPSIISAAKFGGGDKRDGGLGRDEVRGKLDGDNNAVTNNAFVNSHLRCQASFP